MSAIAADVGGSKATLWNHFKSKDDLFAELVKTDTEGIHAEALVILDREGETFEILCTFAETYITAMSTPAPLRLQRQAARSEERTVGTEWVRTCRLRWEADYSKKNK